MDRPGWVLETRPFFSQQQISVTTHTPRFRRKCSRAMISAVMTAVGASDVAGDTPWAILGPSFHGNLAGFHTTHPLPPPRVRVFCMQRVSPATRIFAVSEANDGEYSTLLSLICPRHTFRSTKATLRPHFGNDFLSTFWGRLLALKNQPFVGGAPLHSTPTQLQHMIIKQLISCPCCPFVHNGLPSSQFPPFSTPPPPPQQHIHPRCEFHKT